MEYILIGVLGLVGALAVVLFLGWLGLRVKPKPFPAYPEKTPSLSTVGKSNE